MATANKFNVFVKDLASKVHNLGADTLKVMLSDVAPVATNALKGDLTDITAGNGYTAGGNTLSLTSSAQTGGLYKLILADSTFTAVTANMAQFRYVILYNDTPSSPLKPVIEFWDYGSEVVLAPGESFVVDFDGTNGVLQIQ